MNNFGYYNNGYMGADICYGFFGNDKFNSIMIIL